jgi:subtilisin family serine protease
MAIQVGPDGLRQLESLRGIVARVTEDRPRRLALSESVPRIQADQAVALGYDGTGTVIVIMDTGIETGHPFLQDGTGASRVVAEACFSSNDPSASVVSLCPGAPSTPGGTWTDAAGSGEACSSLIDGCSHGTLVAGIAAGRGASFNGVAPGAELIAVQIFSQFNDPVFCGGAALTPCVASYLGDELAGSLYVRDTLLTAFPNIAAVNLSFGSGGFSIPCDARFPVEAALIADLRARGVATVAASGNEGRTNAVAAPACIGSAISVGATTAPPSETVASFSNRAPGMSLVAPGVSIDTSTTGGGFESANGTSVAAPHVAGVFALFKQAVPTATVDEVLEALQTTGAAVSGYKRVKVLEAMGTFPNTVPHLQFSSPTFSTNEGDGPGSTIVTVTRTGPANLIAGTTATVQFSTGGGTATPGTTGAADYVATSQALTFSPGQTSKLIPIPLNGDFTLERDETVGLSLTSPNNAVLGTPGAATLTIASDDQAGAIEFDQSTYTVDESLGIATITLRRTGGLAADITALVSTVGGGTATATTDYTAFTNKVVTFAGGATTATFTVSIVNDTLAEADETVRLQISRVSPPATIGVQSTATLTIHSEDIAGTVQFSADEYTVTEGTATAVITVTRTGTSSGTTVQYHVIGGTADGGSGTTKDYTLATGTLTFNANETVKTFAVTIANDFVIEPDQTVIIELFNPSIGLSYGTRRTATLTIHDNDAPTIKFGAATYRTVEGLPGAIVVTRTGGLGSPVTVDYQVMAGTATGGVDYTLTGGTLSFAVGSGSLTLSVPTNSDSIYKPDKTVIIHLLNPSRGVVGLPHTTTLTIADHDAPGTFQFSAPTYSVWENAGPAIVRVTRTGTNLASGITVQFTTTNGTAIAGPSGDYTDSSQTLTFAAREAFKDVAIPILDESLPEGNETVLLALSNPSTGATLGATKTAVLTILDDEQTLQFSAPVYVVNESAGSVTVTVTRSGPTVGIVTVDYATAAGTATSGVDYTDVSGTLTFAAGVASRTFTVPIVNDTPFEGAESITLVLRHPGGVARLGPLSTATITVLDNDPPGAIRFSASAYTVSEAAGVATITVQRTPGATASAVTVDYATVPGGTATPGADYMLISGTLTFKAGEVSKTFTVPIVNDNFDESSETVNLALSNPTGGATLGTPVTAVLTISDEDVPGAIGFSASAYTVQESAGLALITVTRTGTAGAVTVDFTTADGSAIAPVDYTAVSGTLSFGGGETTKTLAVPILEGGLREGNETIRLILLNPTGGATLSTTTSQAVLTIADKETGPVVQFSAAAYSVAENVASGMATVTITRTGSAAARDTVLFRTLTSGTAVLGTDYDGVSNLPVTFAAGQMAIAVQVPIVNNPNIEGSRTVNLALTSPSVGLSLGSPRTAVLTILEDDATIQFAGPTTSVTEGSNAVLTVTRTGGTVRPATVSYLTINGTATGGSDYTAKAGTLTFAAGVVSQTITIATTNGTAVESAKSFTVILSTPTGATLGAPTTATVTINDNDAFGTLQFASAAYTVNEGSPVSLVVTRTGGSAGPVTVHYQTTDGGGRTHAATGGGVDYTTTAGVLTFLNGVVSQTIAVPTKPDTIVEGPESFTVTLSAPGGGASLGALAAAVVTITDDDSAGTVQFSQLSYAVIEGGTATITVTRTGTSGPVAVSFATSDGTASQPADYTGAVGTFTFLAGETTKTFTVSTASDGLTEGTESVNLTLFSPTNGLVLGNPSAATLWILDVQQTVQFASTAATVTEGGFVNVLVTRAGVPDGSVTVNYQVTGASTATEFADYTLTPGQGTLTFLPGITTVVIKMQAVNDAELEGPESIVLSLSNPAGATLGTPTTTRITLLDNERPDLVVTSLTGPLQAATGLPMTIVATVQNKTGGMAPATTLGVFLSPSSNTPGAGVRIGVVPIPSLAGGASFTATAAVSVPLDLATGDYFFSAMADVLAAALEEVETNNGLTAATQVSVVVMQPDLVVSTIAGPLTTPRGKPVSIPMTVRNLGPVASGPYRVGVFVSEDADPAVAATTGILLGVTDMPSLAPGASAAVTTSITPPVVLPQGTYWVSAVVDLNHSMGEPNEINNGLTSFTATKVQRPLSKLNRAAISLTPSGCGDVFGQAINLGGAFVLTTIGASTANGTFNLTGNFNGDPTRASRFKGTFTAAFNGSNDDLSLTMVFTSITGFFTGIGSASAAGTYDGRVFEAESPDDDATPALTGSLTRTTTAETCTFGGSLTVIGDPSYSLTFNVSATGGAFGGAQTPTLAATPIAIAAFAPLFEVASDENFPTAGSVKFTGPAGSGFSTPGAFATQSTTTPPAGYAMYQPAAVTGAAAAVGPTGGAWSVLYKAISRAFTVSNPEASARLVILRPSVTLNGGNIEQVSWTYVDRTTGASLAAPPPFVSQIQVLIKGAASATVCASPAFDRTTTAYATDPSSDPDCPSLVPFSSVTAIHMTYVDSLTGNRYTVMFPRP